jgi:hypothetical protein
MAFNFSDIVRERALNRTIVESRKSPVSEYGSDGRQKGPPMPLWLLLTIVVVALGLWCLLGFALWKVLLVLGM